MAKAPDFPSRLLRGYSTFREQRLPQESSRYKVLAETGQRPRTMIVGCSDSRAAPETIFDAAPGELFVVRNVAALVPPFTPDGEHHGTSAAIEFGVLSLKVRDLVVMGHGRCGGITGYLAARDAPPDLKGHTDFVGKWISLLKPAEALICEDPAETADRQRAMEFASIRQTIANLRTFPWIRSLEEIGELELHGAWFDISTAELYLLDKETGRFTVPEEIEV
ncbi:MULTISPECIES: carbonic anhydrase [Kaistia]|uniref:carbonic anhydrase n=1 Tax=Kaistia nematophila TaxID=2994654 RepID=A0A9X3ILN9_9HYPH|nr:carbonic anhydrase [Kaistia nematophila]MBN9059152.1 carbonic anhydrase [Hyphomicrobiales bacterium]MCX5569736.1 carbonic anhydrase [Kaistia nematophila]